MNTPTRYPPQKGTWTLIAPDGRRWEADTPLAVAAKEQRERIPASVALERIYRAMDDETSSQETEALPAAMAKAGDQVRYLDENGYPSECPSYRKRGLVKDALYTVKSISMSQTYTSIYLEGFEGGFNSVCFELAPNR